MEAPTVGRIVFLYDANESATVNSDIKAYLSRNDGLDYQEVDLVDQGAYNGTHAGETWKTAPTDDDTYRILAGTAVLSGQTLTASPTGAAYPSGAPIMTWKIRTFNNKYQRIRGVSHMWYQT